MKDEAREKQEFEVFLSHNSQDKPAVRALAALLTERGVRVWLDEEQLIPGRPWQPLMEQGIKESATGAVLVGADGLGPWEDEEMQVLLRLAVKQQRPVIPVLLPGASREPDLPLFLSNRTWVDLRAGFGTEGIDRLIWGITGEHPSRRPAPSRASEPIIAVTRLRHGADRLVGREKELTRLDTAWQDPKTHVVTIVAWGGVGKTALVVEWMARMARDGWRGAERVFDWSFYSQGTREQGAASADTFIAKALEFFGDPDMAKGAAAAWDKGSRLAQLVAQKRTLLVLDGVEPLQYPPGPVGGQLKDPALEALLKGLTQRNPGLCIVTTRESVTDLKPYRDTTGPEWLLEHLSEEAGAHLLFETGVKRAGNAHIQADDKELKDAAREVGGHALTLQLLGRYLAKVHNGDVRKRDLVRFEKADARVQGGHAFKVMAIYERWLLGKGDEDALRQLAVLRLLGLFDRPADAGCLGALRKKPAIAGLTEPLVGLNDDDWNYTVSNLVECGLISCQENGPQIPNRQYLLDCHPLIREYFAQQLGEQDPDTWKAAHRRLYGHLRDSTKEGDTPFLDDLQPLYQAITHGCLSGLHREAFRDIFWRRVMRGDAFLSTTELGAVQSDLCTLNAFLDRPSDPTSVKGVTGRDRAQLLGHLGYCLRAAGRLEEAVTALQMASGEYRGLGEHAEAVTIEGVLCHTHVLLGELPEAHNIARRCAILAKGFGETWCQITALSRLAEIDLYMGNLCECENHYNCAFELVEGKSERTERVLCYGKTLTARSARVAVVGFMMRYCEASIANRQFKIAVRLAEGCRTAAEEDGRESRNELHEGLVELYLGEASLGLAEEALDRGQVTDAGVLLTRAQNQFEHALRLVTGASRQYELPRVWIPLSLLRSRRAAIESESPLTHMAAARDCLDNAWQTANRGPMRLHMADIHLHRARLFHGVTPYPWGKDEQGKPRGPKDDLAAARKLIEQCGYWRRKEELEDAEEAIGTASKPENGL